MTAGNELVEKIALILTRTGTDKINFKILEMVRDGANVDKIMKDVGLTKVPVNIRLNKLERVGLVNRWRGTGTVVLTGLGKDFMMLIHGYQSIVKSNLMDMLKKIYDH